MPREPHESQVIERLRWQVDRCEVWVGNADTKATIVLGLNGALITGVLAVAPEVITDFLERGWFFRGLAVVFALSVIISCICAALAVLPRLGRARTGGSVFHFMDVKLMGIDEFKALSNEMNPRQETSGLAHQVYIVSCIAADKYLRLRLSVFGLLTGLLAGLTVLFTHNLVN